MGTLFLEGGAYSPLGWKSTSSKHAGARGWGHAPPLPPVKIDVKILGCFHTLHCSKD